MRPENPQPSPRLQNRKSLPYLLLLLWFLSVPVVAAEPHSVTLKVGAIKFNQNFRCDGSPGIKIALHDLYIENIPRGWTTRFRLRLFQKNTELEELRVELPDNNLPSTPAAFPGEAVWFCLADYLLEEFSNPQLEYSATIELLETDSEEVLSSLPVTFRYRRK